MIYFMFYFLLYTVFPHLPHLSLVLSLLPCEDCDADGTFSPPCKTVGGQLPACSTITASSNPSLATLCSGGIFSGELVADSANVKCADLTCGTSSKNKCCLQATSGKYTFDGSIGCWDKAESLCGAGTGGKSDLIFAKDEANAAAGCIGEKGTINCWSKSFFGVVYIALCGALLLFF